MAKDKPITILSLFASYSVVVCALYLFGYWSSFGINILEFMSLSDIIRLGVYPVVFGIVGGAAAAFIIGFVSGEIIARRGFQKTGNEDAATVRRIHSITQIIIFVLVIGLAVIYYLLGNPKFWELFALIFALVLILTIKDFKMLEPFIPIPAVRRAVLIIGISVLLYSFSLGKVNAQEVLNNKSAQIVSTLILKEYGTDAFISKGLLEGQDTLKYVGAAGDYFIFVTLDNSTIYVVKYSDLHFLELRTLH